MHELGDMKIAANKDELLATLRVNREKHAKIVVEAREGYLKAAMTALTERMEQLKSGKTVALAFRLTPPVDQTKVYDTAIRMLELHQGDVVTLEATQVRNLVMDQWDWSAMFIASNRAYSATAAAMSDSDE